MPTARSGLGAAVAGGRIHVIGGEDLEAGCVSDRHEVYDPATDRWEAWPPAPVPRHGLGVVAVGDTLYVVGGGIRPGFQTFFSATGWLETLPQLP